MPTPGTVDSATEKAIAARVVKESSGARSFRHWIGLDFRIADSFLRFSRSHGPLMRVQQMLRPKVMAAATCIATTLEKRSALPVGALVPEPIFASTHATTIDAPPEQVWPWIAQMGAGRAGSYSWDAIDNGGTPSANRVVPEFQPVVPGDVMPAVPRATNTFVVASVDPPRDLVLTVPDGMALPFYCRGGGGRLEERCHS